MDSMRSIDLIEFLKGVLHIIINLEIYTIFLIFLKLISLIKNFDSLNLTIKYIVKFTHRHSFVNKNTSQY